MVRVKRADARAMDNASTGPLADGRRRVVRGQLASPDTFAGVRRRRPGRRVSRGTRQRYVHPPGPSGSDHGRVTCLQTSATSGLPPARPPGLVVALMDWVQDEAAVARSNCTTTDDVSAVSRSRFIEARFPTMRFRTTRLVSWCRGARWWRSCTSRRRGAPRRSPLPVHAHSACRRGRARWPAGRRRARSVADRADPVRRNWRSVVRGPVHQGTESLP